MFGESVGNLFKSPRKPAEVREGARYRHCGPGDLVETAEVLHVGPDPMGIPHVRYRVLVGRSRDRGSDFETSRTLNLDTFATYFTEPVDA